MLKPFFYFTLCLCLCLLGCAGTSSSPTTWEDDGGDIAGRNAPPPASTPVPPGNYVIDPERSSVSFTINKNGKPLAGTFETVVGSYTPPLPLLSDPNKNQEPGQLYAAVEVISVNTNHGIRDINLQAGAYFDKENFPVVEYRGEVTTNFGGVVETEGTLTLLGVERPLKASMTYTGSTAESRVHRGGFTIHRSDFGFTTGLANDAIGDRVDLELELHWVPAPSVAEAAAR
ncbi:MAG: YceI family protein [Planctomycetota bacterium]